MKARGEGVEIALRSGTGRHVWSLHAAHYLQQQELHVCQQDAVPPFPAVSWSVSSAAEALLCAVLSCD